MSDRCAAVGVLKEWKLSLYGSSMSPSQVKERQTCVFALQTSPPVPDGSDVVAV